MNKVRKIFSDIPIFKTLFFLNLSISLFPWGTLVLFSSINPSSSLNEWPARIGLLIFFVSILYLIEFSSIVLFRLARLLIRFILKSDEKRAAYDEMLVRHYRNSNDPWRKD